MKIIESSTIAQSAKLQDTKHLIEQEEFKKDRRMNNIIKALVMKNRERFKNFIQQGENLQMF